LEAEKAAKDKKKGKRPLGGEGKDKKGKKVEE
jgi:hypothetical protein